jgi:hypothetical protein
MTKSLARMTGPGQPDYPLVRPSRSVVDRLRRLDIGLADGWKRRVPPVALHPAECPLTEPTAGAQRRERELVFMPHTCRSQHPSGPAQLGGKPPLIQRYRIGLC